MRPPRALLPDLSTVYAAILRGFFVAILFGSFVAISLGFMLMIVQTFAARALTTRPVAGAVRAVMAHVCFRFAFCLL